MPRETTIPALPCASVGETAAFYALFGFVVTYKQSAPYLYLALRRGEVDLHFHGLPGLDPAKAFSTCLWIVPEVEALYAEFAAALRAAYDAANYTYGNFDPVEAPRPDSQPPGADLGRARAQGARLAQCPGEADSCHVPAALIASEAAGATGEE